MANSDMSFNGDLDICVTRVPRPHRARSVRIPKLGRFIFTRDPGESNMLANEFFQTNVHAAHRDGDGKLINEYDLGSGTITNIGVMAMANDPFWTNFNPSIGGTNNTGVINALVYHATGTGSTPAAATDFKLQTPASPTATTVLSTTQSSVSAANLQIFQVQNTLNYTTTLAITEWGLFCGNNGVVTNQSATTGTPFTATSGTSGTSTGTSLPTGTGAALQGCIVIPGTTAVWGLITSNTNAVMTVAGWFKQSDGTAGSTPGSTEAYTLRPIMWDHKVFSAINVVNGDSIQFTYQMTIQSGG